MHWRIRGRWSWRTSFYGGTDNAKGHKGGECCYVRGTFIHKSAIECTTSHRGAKNGKSTTNVDGNGAVCDRSSSQQKMHNPK